MKNTEIKDEPLNSACSGETAEKYNIPKMWKTYLEKILKWGN